MRLATAVIATVYLLPPPSTRLLSLQALAADTTSFTRQVSPSSETNATEPSVAVDRSDGTEWVAWQASGTHVARSDDGGHTFVQTPISNLFGSDVGDVDIRVGGPTPCSVVTSSCSPGTHRVYVSSLEKLPLVLQTHVAYSDDRGASWTINNLAAVNPSFIDRPWLAVFASKASANLDQVYISYHDFSASQISVTASNDGGQTFGPSVDVLAQNGMAETQSFCNTVPSGIEVDPETGEVYVEWITADPVANTTQRLQHHSDRKLPPGLDRALTPRQCQHPDGLGCPPSLRWKYRPDHQRHLGHAQLQSDKCLEQGHARWRHLHRRHLLQCFRRQSRPGGFDFHHNRSWRQRWSGMDRSRQCPQRPDTYHVWMYHRRAICSAGGEAWP